jgi:hypothetical protein
MSTFKPPSPPFIEARFHGGSQTPKAIVMHATVSPDNPGTARDIANWWHGPTSPQTSAHYVRDPKETIQCVGDHTVAYHCGYNTGSIAYELCDEQVGPATRWSDADSRAIIKGAAEDVARLCLAYDIAPIRPSVAELKRKGPHGIYGHNDSRLAFGNTTHSDPRDFPWRKFLRMVRAEIKRLRAEQSATPKPPKQKKHLDITVSTFNAGPARVRQIIRAIRDSGATALQEMSDQAKVLAALPAYGIGVVTSKLVGTAATPFAYDKSQFRLIRKVIFKVLEPQNIGPGAGPSRNKPKYFVGGLFEVLGTGGEKVIMGSAHDVPTQGAKLRRRAALKLISALNKGLIGRKRRVICGADWNAAQDAPSMVLLHKQGWNFTPERPTHGQRPIDYFIWKDSERRPGDLELVTVDVMGDEGSDHRRYKATFRLWY